MWISGGEHELSENIVHLVLAKIPGPDGKLVPGVKGISLFIVPKKLVHPDGSLTGEPATHVGLPEGWSVDYAYDAGNNIALIVPGGAQIPGDATGDGNVDENDAQRLAQNWGTGTSTEPATWAQGNFDDDDFVGPKDASIMAANWGYGPTEATSVPEPSVVVMLLATLGTLLVWRRR